MIIGLGIDLVENMRVERELVRGEWLLSDGVFRSEEISSAHAGRGQARGYAACFAAKEAALKAMGAEVSDLAIFREVEVRRDETGRYAIALHGRVKSKAERLGVRRVSVSIAAAKKQTGAMVILES